MEEQEVDPQNIIEKIKEYIHVRTELSVLSAVDKGSQLFANLLTDGLVLVFTILAGLFGSFALGFYLSEVLNNTYGGFLIVAGIYLIGAVLLNSIKDRFLEKRIINLMIKKFFKVRNVEQHENKDS
ncbi:MAG: phage holin family protein [Daejeonella sp.]|uniref:phage holin family protein n=1 Tax=Daejeonella sp. TaxID=2805397 RepID=UPI002733CCF0|nr:phage holin family protein [Daejeonella sp.]MDP3467187.1 phage holin family protein [Daejeonella sp.]